jgi:hypothetical protein
MGEDVKKEEKKIDVRQTDEERGREKRAARRDGTRVQKYIYNVRVGNDARWMKRPRMRVRSNHAETEKKRGRKIDGRER